ncbi:MAG: hypothetical protein IT370_20460 [Deltaproteobacteria bacterium]|nr:hypothetical protein [Deltaproteobacteria bacterium]
MEGKRDVIEGVAEDAKQGAVVVRDAGAVFVAGLDGWPRELRGRRVRVTGHLRTIAGADEPLEIDGLHRAGSLGDRRVIEDATWEALER